MGAGGRREKEAVEGGINGKRAMAEDMRQVEGVRGTTEKSNNVRGYWEDTQRTKTWEKTASGRRKGRGKSAGALPHLSSSLPQDSSLQHRAHLGLTGAVTPPLETPGWS